MMTNLTVSNESHEQPDMSMATTPHMVLSQHELLQEPIVDQPPAGQIVDEPNVWEQICREFADKSTVQPHIGMTLPTNEEPTSMKPSIDILADCLLNAKVTKDNEIFTEDYRVSCIPRDFLEKFIFPTLLPALEAMLRQAKLEKCFERKRTKFNALDFLTEYLYTQNPQQENRTRKDLWDIPFVIEWLKDHPRQPLPLSLIWTEIEAATVIQSHWRGYKVRCDPEIQELRQWQREWREMNGSISDTVHQFWEKKLSRLSSQQMSNITHDSNADGQAGQRVTPTIIGQGTDTNVGQEAELNMGQVVDEKISKKGEKNVEKKVDIKGDKKARPTSKATSKPSSRFTSQADVR